MTSDIPSMKIEISQKKHTRFDMGKNLALMKDAIRSTGSDLLIFPEMFLTGYTLGDDVFRMAIGTDSDVIRELKDLCREHGKFLIFGFPERSGRVKGQVHNSAAILGPDGLMGVYRKMHLVDFGPFEEYAYFTPGDELVLVEVNGYKIGLMICYDIYFPELTKIYALKGADIVVCISASPSVTRKFFEHLMVSRAIENTIFFAYSNLVGFDSKMDFWGGGALIGPRGDIISKGPYFEEATITAEVDLHSIELSRRFRPTIRDTKFPLLRELAKIEDIKGP